ncbi:histidine phosphatase family protein [Lactobacillus bombicola]|uniref:Histidine phosphatase family protein n=1 Tax=Lactobacillus bombicola TaxID=1505723 RepID=A0A396SV53_9LACO|nr:histidine phosphatase family protein [Lactobacillus bombicola]RHW50440.1 histidine phosphatase family protein [Lactobacillus bombicola]RHW53047.1 histidine phosphatase family protein [Lactobacillus bombicola]RHW54550.1 histidine phosphatase family protein [Lactobacillus bombicola]
MQIYFVRHGKTEWNNIKRFQGAHGDSPLLPQSLIDITKLGKYLQKEKFAAIYASPLKRAYDTATRLKQTMGFTHPVNKDERLREFDLGKLEGLKFEEATLKFPAQVNDLWQRPDQYDGKSIGGENYLDVITRGKNFAQEIVQKYDHDDKIIAVSHGAALGAIMGGLLGYPLDNLRQNGGLNNTSLTILETTNHFNFKLIVWNETSFLERKMVETDSL